MNQMKILSVITLRDFHCIKIIIFKLGGYKNVEIEKMIIAKFTKGTMLQENTNFAIL
jgi:hypothetical protein